MKTTYIRIGKYRQILNLMPLFGIMAYRRGRIMKVSGSIQSCYLILLRIEFWKERRKRERQKRRDNERKNEISEYQKWIFITKGKSNEG